jgi:hypothetical protein
MDPRRNWLESQAKAKIELVKLIVEKLDRDHADGKTTHATIAHKEMKCGTSTSSTQINTRGALCKQSQPSYRGSFARDQARQTLNRETRILTRPVPAN